MFSYRELINFRNRRPSNLLFFSPRLHFTPHIIQLSFLYILHSKLLSTICLLALHHRHRLLNRQRLLQIRLILLLICDSADARKASNDSKIVPVSTASISRPKCVEDLIAISQKLLQCPGRRNAPASSTVDVDGKMDPLRSLA